MTCPISVEEAAQIILSGGVVAFPTETVYGLGANALDPVAIRRIYQLKGRPATSPLIVHVDSIEMAQSLADEWPLAAEGLARRYWPGPLTIVVRKSSSIPDQATAGLDTVGLRMPAHPMALALIRACGVPLAAPSANKFTQLSPTTAAHVMEAFGDEVPVLDGGPTEVGIESTVVSVVDGGITLLRPGMIHVPGAAPVEIEQHDGAPHASPGLHHKHYSPKTPVILVNSGDAIPEGSAYIWHRTPAPTAAKSVQLPSDPAGFAAAIYGVLHDLDHESYAAIVVERVQEDEPEWAAIADRLRRASAGS